MKISKRSKPKNRRMQVRNLPKSEVVLTGKELKKVKGGAAAQQLESAAKQLDATSISGGPTAAQ
jgi:hypothetical protein